MKGRKWMRINVAEYERLMKAEAEAQALAMTSHQTNELCNAEAQNLRSDLIDAEEHIKKLEADLERVRGELVEYKRMYADEVEKRITGLAMILSEGKEMSIEDELRHPVSGASRRSAGE